MMNDREEYNKNGHVTIRNVFNKQEMFYFHQYIKNAIKYFNKKEYFKSSESYEKQFTQFLNPWKEDPILKAITFNKKLAKLASELSGLDNIRLWQSQLLIKYQDSNETIAHQDLPFWPMETDEAISLWFPINGSNINNGTLYFLPGSHKLGVKEFTDIVNDKEHNLLMNKQFKSIKPVPIILNSGDISFHHPLTVHLSSQNKSAEPRIVYSIVYFKDGMKRSKKGKHFIVDEKNNYIDSGQKINNKNTPIIYKKNNTISRL